MISINNLTAGYSNTPILNNISINIPSNKFISIIGPNGSGKTTLLKILIKTLNYTKGELSLDNHNYKNLSQKQISQLVSFVPQKPFATEGLSVTDVLLMANEANKIFKNDISNLLNKYGYTYLINKKINQISGGEAQIIMLCRAILRKTPYILLDEPTNNLDLHNQTILLQMLEMELTHGKTIICVIHDLNIALKHSNYTIVLNEGHIHASGKPSDIINEELISTIFKSHPNIVKDTATNKILAIIP